MEGWKDADIGTSSTLEDVRVCLSCVWEGMQPARVGSRPDNLPRPCTIRARSRGRSVSAVCGGRGASICRASVHVSTSTTACITRFRRPCGRRRRVLGRDVSLHPSRVLDIPSIFPFLSDRPSNRSEGSIRSTNRSNPVRRVTVGISMHDTWLVPLDRHVKRVGQDAAMAPSSPSARASSGWTWSRGAKGTWRSCGCLLGWTAWMVLVDARQGTGRIPATPVGHEYCNWNKCLGHIPPLDETRESKIGLELVQVQTLQRHGSRAPRYSNCWPKDKAEYRCENDYSPITQVSEEVTREGGKGMRFRLVTAERQLNRGNCMSQQLLGDGFLQLHCNGMGFREAYRNRIRFLPNPQENLQKQATLHASYTSRCLDSMEAFLTGIYPEQNLTERDGILEIETQDPQYDTLASRGPGGQYEPTLCPATKLFAPDRLLSLKEQESVLGLARKVALGVRGMDWDPLKVTLQEAMDTIDSTVGCYELHMCTNQSLATYPANLTQDLARSLLDTQAMYVKASESRKLPGLWSSRGERLTHASLAIGPFMGRLIHHADALLQGGLASTRHRFVAYTGHGTNFAQLAVVLGIPDDIGLLRVPFGTSFTMELYEDQEGRLQGPDHWVRFVCNGRVLHLPPSVCGVRGGSASHRLAQGLCPWSILRRHLMRQVPTLQDCARGGPSAGPLPPRRAWWPGATSSMASA